MIRIALPLGLTIVMAAVMAGCARAEWTVPPEWNPWAMLDVGHPLTPVTQWKLRQLPDHPATCRKVIANAPSGLLDYEPVPDHEPVPGCPLENVVRIRQAGVRFNRSFVASCPLTVAWIMYVRHGVQPAARALFGEPVDRVTHYGSFACRNIGNMESGRPSEHAAANALDVAGFRLRSGKGISVLRHWNGNGRKAEFLRRTFETACDVFGTSLGPEYNAAHANHFHFGMRGRGFCE